MGIKKKDNVIIDDSISMITDPSRKDYKHFIYCYEGRCDMVYGGTQFTITPDTCTILLISKNLTEITPSADFKCCVIDIEEGFMRQSEPKNPYMIQGTLSLQTAPVMQLEGNEIFLCSELFKNFALRVKDLRHRFYDDILRTSTRMLLLDLYDIHSRITKSDKLSKSSAGIMARFIDMLSSGEYRNNREVAYYAEQLCVVPKYLSEVCNKISGNSASYWINKYTSEEINELLLNQKMTSAQVAKMFHFTSVSYFNRYVKRYLGVYPSELRGQ